MHRTSIVLLLAAFLNAVTLGPIATGQPDEEGDPLAETAEIAEKVRAEREREFNAVTEKLAEMHEELGIDATSGEEIREMLGLPKVSEEDDDAADPIGIFGIGEFRRRSSAGREVADGLVVTDRDIEAMERYVSNEFDAVAEILQPGSEEAEPFSRFLLGCALFELQRYEAAEAHFRAVDEAVSASVLPVLLAEIAARLKDDVKPSPSALLEVYDDAYQKLAAENRIVPPGGFAGAGTSAVVFDPLFLRMGDLYPRASALRAAKLMEEFGESENAERQMTIAVLFSGMNKQLGASLWTALTDQHPDCREARVMLLLKQEFDDENRESEAENVAQLQALEPENGAFALLGIRGANSDYDSPLNRGERVLLERATTAKSFETYTRFCIEDAQSESFKRFGALGTCPAFSTIRVIRALRRVMRRIVATASEDRRAGNAEAARALLNQAETLLERYEPECETLLQNLVRLSLRRTLSKGLQEHAANTGDAQLLARALEMRGETSRMETRYMFGARDIMAAAQMPLLSFQHANMDFERDSRLCPGRASRMLRFHRAKIRAETLDRLEYIEYSRDNMDFDRYILTAEFLKLREALPALRKLTESKLPFNVYLAKQAIEAIEGNENPPEE